MIAKIKPTALNEIAGYQFARSVGLGVLDSHWFTAEKRLDVPGIRLERGEAGMLLTKITPADATAIELSELAKIEPQTVARTCALFALDRGEWAQIWLVDETLHLLDLEMMFARFAERARDRKGRMDDYREMTPAAFRAARAEAMRCGVEVEFNGILADWKRKAEGGEFAFDFTAHRRGHLVADFFLKSIRMRLGLIAGLTGRVV